MPKRNLVWILVAAAGALVTVWVTRTPEAPPTGRDPALEEVQQAYRLITRLCGGVPLHRLQQGAVQGMVTAVDDYSSFVPGEKAARFQARLAGLGQGLGLVIERRGPVAVVAQVQHGSPSWRAELERGDVLVEVDGRDCRYLTESELSALMDDRPLGEAVELTVLRGPGCGPVRLSLVCAQFPLESIEGLYRGDDGQWAHQLATPEGLAYLRVREFLPRTAQELLMALRRQRRLEGLVLDLRGNPGGLLTSAVEVADLFLSEGLIVSVVGEPGQELRDYRARPDGTLPNELAMVVLVDGGTASAAEVVAGALQTHSRALLVGQPTRGKDCLQSMVELPLGQANLTTGRLVLARMAGEAAATKPPSALPLAPDVREQVLPANRMALHELSVRAGQLYRRGVDGSRDKGAPATQVDPADFIRQRLALDAPLAAAAGLLEQPEQLREVLERKSQPRRAATQPAERE